MSTINVRFTEPPKIIVLLIAKSLHVKFTNDGLSFFLFYFSFFTFILFYFLVFLFLKHRVRVKSQDTKNKVEGSRINDVI